MDNSPEAVKGRVRSMTKAIRYKARKEGNLMKAFNDYMSGQSGISATERSAVKSSLGLSENKWRTAKSDWRAELNEVVDGEGDKMVKEKKVKNKIVINPVVGMKEAFEALGGEIIEIVEEVEVDESMSPKEIQLQKRRSQIDMQIARDRRREVAKASTDKNKDAPTKAVGEGYGMGEIDQKVGAVTPIPKKEQDAARARLLAKTKAKREAKMKEGLDKETKKSMDEFFRRAFNAKIPHSLQEDEVDEGMLHRDAKTGEAVAKAEVGKTYYPNMPKKKSSVALRKEKEMKKEEVEVDEAMRPGPRQRKMAQKRFDQQATSRDRATAHNVAVRNDGPGTDSYEKKSTGGKGARYAGYGDQGAGNKARRRMGEKPLRGDTRKEEFASEEASDAMKDRRMERGGVDGNVDYKRPPAKPNTFGKKPSDPKAKQRAVDRVRDDIIKRYGKGALISTKKK